MTDYLQITHTFPCYLQSLRFLSNKYNILIAINYDMSIGIS